jgi:antitoxin component YwqK of YwqJK toxin-antitoxin module
VRHGREAYVYAPSGAEPRLLCMLEWNNGVCKDRFAPFNMTSINLSGCKMGAPFEEQQRHGKTVEMLPNDVMRITHWRTADGMCQKHGPCKEYMVMPERGPVLLREMQFRCGRLDGAEVMYCDADCTAWTAEPARLIEINRRHWCNGALEGPELCFEPSTGMRVERQWRANMMCGMETRRYANGRRQMEANYVDGCLEGEWRLWFKGGNICERGTFMRGRRHGTWIRCNRAGQLIKCTEYAMGRQWGNCMQRNADGTFSSECINDASMIKRRRDGMQRQLDVLRAQMTACEPGQKPRMERKIMAITNALAQ